MNKRPSLVALAEWLSSQKTAALPQEILHIAKRSLIDTLGVMLAGSQHHVARRVRETLPLAPGSANLVGCTVQTDPITAALINGVAAHALDFDDNCYAGFVHGSAVVVPAALAVADSTGAQGESLLKAIALGSECQYRLGMALNNELYHSGWWTTGMLGSVGACAAAATILDLDTTECANALGMAVVSAAGMKAVFGTDSKALLAGSASQRGVMAVLMAQAGISGPIDAIEHSAGLVALCNNHQLVEKWLQEPPTEWCLRVPGIDIKRFPLCLSSHAAVDALLFLQRQHAFTVAEVAYIECDVPDIVRTNLKYDQPLNAQQAQFSLPFAIAQALLAGEITLSQLETSHVLSPALQELMTRVSYHTSECWKTPERASHAPEGAEITVHLHNGTTYRRFVAQARGTASLPLSDDELSTKFTQCCQPILGRSKTQKLLTGLWHIDNPAIEPMSNHWDLSL